MNADHIDFQWKESKHFAEVRGKIHHDSTIQTDLIRWERAQWQFPAMKELAAAYFEEQNHLTQFKVRPQILKHFVEQKSHKLWIHLAVCQNQLPQNFTISNFHLFSIQTYLESVYGSLPYLIQYQFVCVYFECLRQQCRKLILVQRSTFKMT